MSNLGTEKDTLYVDVDDEITTIIDKVRSSNGKVVALVLPKRAAVLQSIVNMKLLKRTAEAAKKHVVLVTTEASLMPLAGNVGLHVASSPTSKPVIPVAALAPTDEPEDIDEPLQITGQEYTEDFDAAKAAAVPVGALAAAGVAGAASAPSKISADAVDEEIQMDDEPEPTAGGAAATAPKPKKNKKLKVPNFDSFRTKLLLGVGVFALLIVGWVFAFIVLPKATITISTDTSTITTNMTLALDTTAKTVDANNKIVPATAQTTQKSYSQQATATGQQNNGTKATGSVTMSAGSCSGSVPDGIDPGTALTSSGHTYILSSSVTFVPTVSKGKCTFTGMDGSGAANIAITALKGGAEYNMSSVTFSVNGRTGISASGSASDGTDNIVKVVSQTDIDGAKAKIATQDTAPVKADLQTSLKAKGLLPVVATFSAGEPQVTTSAKAGDPADTVTVTEVIAYTMLGVKQSDLKTLIEANVSKQIDKNKQVILDNGISKAKFTVQSVPTATGAEVTIQTKSIAGPQIDTEQLRKQVVGKKSGEIKTLIKQTPGVTDVTFKYSPFWVSSVPKNADKVIVQVDKANTGKE